MFFPEFAEHCAAYYQCRACDLGGEQGFFEENQREGHGGEGFEIAADGYGLHGQAGYGREVKVAAQSGINEARHKHGHRPSAGALIWKAEPRRWRYGAS